MLCLFCPVCFVSVVRQFWQVEMRLHFFWHGGIPWWWLRSGFLHSDEVVPSWKEVFRPCSGKVHMYLQFPAASIPETSMMGSVTFPDACKLAIWVCCTSCMWLSFEAAAFLLWRSLVNVGVPGASFWETEQEESKAFAFDISHCLSCNVSIYQCKYHFQSMIHIRVSVWVWLQYWYLQHSFHGMQRSENVKARRKNLLDSVKMIQWYWPSEFCSRFIYQFLTSLPPSCNGYWDIFCAPSAKAKLL